MPVKLPLIDFWLNNFFRSGLLLLCAVRQS
ncbi:hypothetical protein FB106_11836 [Synechococcus sp. Ace-Pa]|nr:hypothetical protein FB106_11836 [Synechococcus sp. Ace-Pa]